MVKAVIFDFDDTLVNTFEPKVLAYQKTARDIYNFELSREKIQMHWGKPYHEMLLLLFEEVTDDLNELLKNFEKIREEFPAELLPEVRETIAVLKEKILLGVVTSTSRPLIYGDLELCGLSPDHFSYIQTFEDTNFHKPDPRVFTPMLKSMSERQIVKNEIIYVGDGIKDFYAARDADLHFYGVANAITTKERFEKEGANVLDSFKKIWDIVDKHADGIK